MPVYVAVTGSITSKSRKSQELVFFRQQKCAEDQTTASQISTLSPDRTLCSASISLNNQDYTLKRASRQKSSLGDESSASKKVLNTFRPERGYILFSE
jgi:hypothetical protein